jgi:hypothetical protein
MRHTTPRLVNRQVESLRNQFAQVEGLPFADVLSANLIDAVLIDEQITFRDRIYSPLITLAMMLSQTQDDDPSLRQAVARLQARRAAQGLPDIDADTGAFSKARGRLPEGVLARLARRSGRRLLHNAPVHWRWCGRDVKIVDGSTLSMPDTAANQNAYPQAKTQKPGLGFPILRFVVLLSLAVGTVQSAAYGPYRGKGTGETALLRQLYDDLNPGDVLLADTYFCTYFVIAELLRRGVDLVVPLHQCRHADFRRSQRVGNEDQVVTWSKPPRPAWMSAAEYDQYPQTIGDCASACPIRRRGGAPSSWSPPCSIRRSIPRPPSPSCFASAGMRNSICVRSRTCSTWTCCAAGRRPWSTRNSGRTYWRTT